MCHTAQPIISALLPCYECSCRIYPSIYNEVVSIDKYVAPTKKPHTELLHTVPNCPIFNFYKHCQVVKSASCDVYGHAAITRGGSDRKQLSNLQCVERRALLNNVL